MRAAFQGAIESGFFEEHEKRPRAVACRQNVPNGRHPSAGIYPISLLIGLDRGRYLALSAGILFFALDMFWVIRTGGDVDGRNGLSETEQNGQGR
jgi:hypothetical protein